MVLVSISTLLHAVVKHMAFDCYINVPFMYNKNTLKMLTKVLRPRESRRRGNMAGNEDRT